MAALPIRVIVGILVMMSLGYPPAIAQPAPRSDAETTAFAGRETQQAEPSLETPAAETPAASTPAPQAGLPVAPAPTSAVEIPAVPSPAPAVETPAAPTPTPAAETPAAPSPAPTAETPAAAEPGPAAAATPPAAPAAPSPNPPIFRAEELDRLLAPIALYPDALLAQILMAATYPLEIVKARRWLQDPRHTALRGDPLAGALEAEGWDPSVKALVGFPPILRMMDANLDWTERLGDAFLAQQGDVMDAIQRLRHQAAAAGSLWSNAQQKAVTEGQGIVIEAVNPAVIYPPVYNPAVYGAWPYPDYPPFDIVPSDYGLGFAVPLGIGFGAGFVVVRSVMRRCAFDWGGRRILLGVDPPYRDNPGSGITAWQHDPAHRRGVPYLDLGSRQRFGVGGAASLAVTTDVAIPRTGAEVAVPPASSYPGRRAFAPVAINPAAPRHRMVPGQLTPQIISRRPPMSTMPQALTPSRGAAGSGSLGWEGRARR